MLLPGPEATQLAVYIGWLLHRTWGGLVAGTLFVLPGFVAIMVLSWLYAGLGEVPVVEALFFGLKAAVLAIVLEAVVRIGRRALRNRAMLALAAAAFVAIFFLDVPFPLIILAAGLIGLAGAGRAAARLHRSRRPSTGSASTTVADAASALGETTPAHARPALAWSLRVTAVCLLLWLGPVLALLTLGGDDVFTRIAVFFSKMAVVTFGGAYAVLAYVAQQAVETLRLARARRDAGWPGPGRDHARPADHGRAVRRLHGRLARSGHAAPDDRRHARRLLTTWVTFVPCFLWIFLGAPFVEGLRGNRALGGALAAITAAVVGVILNLAIWFALHVLFAQLNEVRLPGMPLDVPVPGSVPRRSLVLTAGALLAVFRFNAGMIATLAACAALGVAYHLLGGSV